MDINYLIRREKNIFSRYKLQRRCEIVYDVIRKNLNGHQEIKILDIGACDGKMLSYIKRRIPQVVGIGIEIEKNFIGAVCDKNIRVIASSAENLPFTDKEFDFVINSISLEHIEKDEESLQEVCRVLKDGGKFILLTVMPFYHRLTVLSGYKKDEHFHNYSQSAAEKLFKKIGFRIIEKRKFYFPLFYQLVVGEKYAQ